MKRSIPDLDEQILKTAYEMFYENGLLEVEMKDIAERVGISRSTLYRHYADKLDIAFELVQKEIVALYEIHPGLPEQATGAEETAEYLRIFMENLKAKPCLLRMLREFDMLYDSQTPSSPAMERYEEFFRTYRSPLYGFIKKGQEDGSIRSDMEANELVHILTNTVMTLLQRLLPRGEIYLREHGFGNELFEDALKILLRGCGK